MTDQTRRSQKLTVVFRKGGNARFLSHLDLLATLEYSLRRARLPIELSEGFNPRPRMSLASPLPLGHTGEREILEMTLKEPVPPAEVHERLQVSVPGGIDILSVDETTESSARSGARLESALYRIELPEETPDLQERIDALLAQETVEVQETRQGKAKTRDIRAHIVSVETASPRTIRARLSLDEMGTVRPEQLLDALSIPVEGAGFVREGIQLRD